MFYILNRGICFGKFFNVFIMLFCCYKLIKVYYVLFEYWFSIIEKYLNEIIIYLCM